MWKWLWSKLRGGACGGHSRASRWRKKHEMITYDDAKRLVTEQYSRFLQELGVELKFDESETLEYVWGWRLSYAASDPTRIPENHWLGRRTHGVVVDRSTGKIETVTSAGTNGAIMQLLESRPPELRDGLIEVNKVPNSGLKRCWISADAFKPLGESPEPEGE
ncbi:MAG: hypothetical protein K8T89_07815 [Planctomycetes bacterium]|nr:hypothetical protein [Planctomycetota bacterium]